MRRFGTSQTILYKEQRMRKTVKFDRTVRILVPVWHQPEVASNSKYQFRYKRAMSILELQPDREYKCEELQSLLNRGAMFAHEEDHTYVCSCGFIPLSDSLPVPVSPVTTGLDPEEELN
jgi:hypothetical protein